MNMVGFYGKTCPLQVTNVGVTVNGGQARSSRWSVSASGLSRRPDRMAIFMVSVLSIPVIYIMARTMLYRGCLVGAETCALHPAQVPHRRRGANRTGVRWIMPPSASADQRTDRYHSIVWRSPSSNDVLASKPKQALARATSRHRRGWPSGWEESQRISPAKPVR